jgi:2-polyprenyl-3-methyl-5-hydroxy-6-metoxy-1,4-benzoquinol methylase
MDVEKEITNILSGYQPTCVLMTANELNLFDAVAENPVSAEQLAFRLSLSLKGTERLLNALAGMGIVDKLENSYQLNDEWKPFVTRSGERSMNQWISLISGHLDVWTQLPEYVRKGKPLKSIMEMLGSDPDRMRAFIDAMHNKGLKAAWMVARECPIGEAKHLLDVGGGPGTYALEWCKMHPHLKATIFDIPSVTQVADEYITRYGLQERVKTLAGDFNTDSLGKGYDLILLANVLHMYDEKHSQELVGKAVAALESGGRIIINGLCTDDTQTGPLMDVMFSLNMGMNTPGGRAHPVGENVAWLEEAGLTDVRDFRIAAMPTGVITGIKKN